MKVQVVSLLILISSFYVSCSNQNPNNQGPPTNRRRLNDEIGSESDTEVDADTVSGISLISASNPNSLPPAIDITGSRASFNLRRTTRQILPTRGNNLNTNSGFHFAQPDQSHPTSSSSSSSLGQSSFNSIPQVPSSSSSRNRNHEFVFGSLKSNRTRWVDPADIPGKAVSFDQSEVEFFNIIRSAESEASPPNLRFYGKFTSPENGSTRFFRLPLNGFPADETHLNEIEEESKDDTEEESKDDIVHNETHGESSITVVTEQIATVQSPSQEQTSTQVFPDFPSPQESVIYSTPKSAIIKKYQCSPPAGRNLYNSGSGTESSRLFPSSFSDPCEVAETIFAEEVSHLNTNLQRHTSFPDQETLFESISEFSNSSRLDDRHLRAFELDFGIFYKLVAKCPMKYFLPSLAVSLQYDEDFPKFLMIFFRLKNLYIENFHDEYQNHLIQIILNMKIISRSAFEFFSSHKNGIFFFSDFSTFPCYYGKFSPHKVATIISTYKTKYQSLQYMPQSVMDYSGNPLRKFIFNFDYFTSIKSFHVSSEFARTNLKNVFLLKSLFRNEGEFNYSVYQLFKYSNDKTQFCSNLLSCHNAIKIVLREALKREDFFIIETLFLKFELESNEDKIRYRKLNLYGIDPVSVNVKKINKSFCLVTISIKCGIKPSISLVLPLVKNS